MKKRVNLVIHEDRIFIANKTVHLGDTNTVYVKGRLSHNFYDTMYGIKVSLICNKGELIEIVECKIKENEFEVMLPNKLFETVGKIWCIIKLTKDEETLFINEGFEIEVVDFTTLYIEDNQRVSIAEVFSEIDKIIKGLNLNSGKEGVNGHIPSITLNAERKLVIDGKVQEYSLRGKDGEKGKDGLGIIDITQDPQNLNKIIISYGNNTIKEFSIPTIKGDKGKDANTSQFYNKEETNTLLENLVNKEDLKSLAKKTDLPTIDISNLVNKTELLEYSKKTDIPNIDLSRYAKKSELVTKTSELENDTKFITKEDIPTIDTSNLVKKEDLTNYAKKIDIKETDLSEYVKLQDIPTNISQLTNDGGFITIQDIPKVDVPTKVSELTNDSEYITKEDIPKKLSQFDNDSKFIMLEEIPKVDLTNYATLKDIPNVPTKLSQFANDKHFLTKEEVPKVDLSGYLKTNEVNNKVKSVVNEMKSELKGDKGEQGKSVEFDWKGTELGLRLEGYNNFVYIDLKGQKGKDGVNGITPTISLTPTNRLVINGVEQSNDLKGDRGLGINSIEQINKNELKINYKDNIEKIFKLPTSVVETVWVGEAKTKGKICTLPNDWKLVEIYFGDIFSSEDNFGDMFPNQRIYMNNPIIYISESEYGNKFTGKIVNNELFLIGEYVQLPLVKVQVIK